MNHSYSSEKRADLQSTRKRAINNEIRRLERRLQALEQKHKKWSWWRLGIFTAGVVITYLSLSIGGTSIGMVTLAAFILVFSLVIREHRQLGRWIDRFHAWQEMRRLQVARMDLDWDSLPDPPQPELDAETISIAVDLDLTGPRSIHQLVDRGISREGSQLLADWLTQSMPDLEEIHQRQQLVKELRSMPRFRDRLYLNFKLVSRDPLHGSNLLKWLSMDLPVNRLGILLSLSSLFCLVNISLFILSIYDLVPEIWPVSFLIYLAFYFTNIGSLSPFLDTVVELDHELDKFRSLLDFLESYPYKAGSQVSQACEVFRNEQQRPSILLRKIRRVTAGVGARMNPIMALLLNTFTPWDFAFAFLAGKLRRQAGEALPEWLETWTRMEALINLADYAFVNPGYTFPAITLHSPFAIEAHQLGHPLIPPKGKVCNDFKVEKSGSVILITGSNMAGKSTFVKTIGVNLCLAYAGGPVNALHFNTLPYRLHTCIRISDSITDGFSYFYAEVKCLKRLLDKLAVPDQIPLLYLVDEIFRGTNNRERYLGSLDYIRSLTGTNGIGFIATHDLELANLSDQNPAVINYHFSDSVIEGRLSFDYRILPGPSQTTNALKIMEMEGLPVKRQE